MQAMGPEGQGTLQPGRIMETSASRQKCAIEGFVARVGWAELYRATLEGATVALKWYPDPKEIPCGTEKSLSDMIRKPNPHPAFAWPIDTVAAAPAGWGYLRPWIPESYQPGARLISLQVRASFRALLWAACNFSAALRELHAAGFCCREINAGNLLVEPESGDIRLNNCEDVAVCGEKIATRGSLFVPPESWYAETVTSPSTDRYGLAVFLFWLLVHNHPMIGRLECDFASVSEGQLHCLTHPLFIFHPGDRRNEPTAEDHRPALVFWPRLPAPIRDLFTRTFTEGLAHPEARATEEEWLEQALRAHDSVMPCGHCGSENFYDREAIRKAGGVPPACVECGQRVHLPPRMRLDGNDSRVVVLSPGLLLYPHHTAGRPYELSAPTARVAAGSGPAALVNIGPERWVATTAEGARRDVAPNETIELVRGIAIDFGNARGEIRV